MVEKHNILRHFTFFYFLNFTYFLWKFSQYLKIKEFCRNVSIEAYLIGKGVIEVFVCHQMHNCDLEAGMYNGPKNRQIGGLNEKQHGGGNAKNMTAEC
jgi:hypothetical protein